jgi:hypothetical protein
VGAVEAHGGWAEALQDRLATGADARDAVQMDARLDDLATINADCAGLADPALD